VTVKSCEHEQVRWDKYLALLAWSGWQLSARPEEPPVPWWRLEALRLSFHGLS